MAVCFRSARDRRELRRVAEPSRKRSARRCYIPGRQTRTPFNARMLEPSSGSTVGVGKCEFLTRFAVDAATGERVAMLACAAPRRACWFSVVATAAFEPVQKGAGTVQREQQTKSDFDSQRAFKAHSPRRTRTCFRPRHGRRASAGRRCPAGPSRRKRTAGSAAPAMS